MVVPDDWETVRLEDFADCFDHLRVPLNESERLTRIGDYPYCGANGVLGFIDRYLIDDEMVLIAEDGGYFDEFATRPIAYKMSGKFWVNNHAHVLRAKPSQDNNYLYHSLVHKDVTPYLASGTRAKLNKSEMWKIEIRAPKSKIEQQAIAEALSDVDAAIESLDALIAKKRDIRGAMLFDLVVSSEHKNSVSFKSDVSLKARIGWQGLTTGEYEVSSDCYLVTGTDLNGGAVNWESCWQVAQKRYDQDSNIQLRNNDVLVTKDGTIGKVGFVADLSGRATLNSGVFVIRPTTKNLIPEYLRYVMFSPLFRRFLDRLAAGSTISHLYQKDFVNFAFAVPVVDEQVVVSKILDDVDSEIRTLIEQSAKMRMVKQGMMQDLLTGKVRLV